MKHFYIKKILQNYLAAHDDKDILEVDLSSTLYWIKRAWDSVNITTIQNSFRKAGFQS